MANRPLTDRFDAADRAAWALGWDWKGCPHHGNDPWCDCRDPMETAPGAALEACLELKPGMEARTHLERAGWRVVESGTDDGRWVRLTHPELPDEWGLVLGVGPRGATRFRFWAG